MALEVSGTEAFFQLVSFNAISNSGSPQTSTLVLSLLLYKTENKQKDQQQKYQKYRQAISYDTGLG